MIICLCLPVLSCALCGAPHSIPLTPSFARSLQNHHDPVGTWRAVGPLYVGGSGGSSEPRLREWRLDRQQAGAHAAGNEHDCARACAPRCESHLRGRLEQRKRVLSLFDRGYGVFDLRGVGRSAALGRGRFAERRPFGLRLVRVWAHVWVRSGPRTPSRLSPNRGGGTLETATAFTGWIPPIDVIALLSGIMADAGTLNLSLATLQLDDHFWLPASLPCSHGRQAAMTTVAKRICASVRARSSVPLSLNSGTIST